MVLINVLYKVILTIVSMNKILKYDHSNCELLLEQILIVVLFVTLYDNVRSGSIV